MFVAAAALGALGLTAALALSAASKIFAVETDPRVEFVEDALAGANCGGCGYPGCHAAANAIVQGKAPVNMCVAGGAASAEKVAEIMGVSVDFREVEFAERGCRGGSRGVLELFNYVGVQDCRAAMMLADGPSGCEFSCLGFGTCARNCPFDAITMSDARLPEIDYDRCTGCGVCARICPKGVMQMVSESQKALHWVTKNQCAPPCQLTCPTQIEIQRYLNFIAERQFEEALHVIKEHTPLPMTLGRVCPAPCEEVCRRRDVDEPVNINHCKRFVADLEYEQGERFPVFVRPDTGHKVAIIGGGPAGLTCAYYLRRMGHAPTIFESQPELGGALRYGIPKYRLPREVLDWEIEGILELGVEVRKNLVFGEDFTFNSLTKEGFEAFFLATGTPRGIWPGCPGQDLEGVATGIDFLRDIALGKKMDLGHKVLVVGGGNVAVDVALSALRFESVTECNLICLEHRFQMPAWAHDVEDALMENVLFHNCWGPNRIIGENGRVKEVEFKRCLSVFDETGRFNPQYDESQVMRIDADQVFLTIGQGTDLSFMKSCPELAGLEITRRGTVVTQPDTMQTNIPNVFAAGEIISGPNIAVQAIGGGRKAASSIHRFLSMEIKEKLPPKKELLHEALDKVDRAALREVGQIRRPEMPRLAVKYRAKNWNEVNLGFYEDQAVEAAKRCLNCGIYCLRSKYEAKTRDFLKKPEGSRS